MKVTVSFDLVVPEHLEAGLVDLMDHFDGDMKDMLQREIQMVGSQVFWFLAQGVSGSLPYDYYEFLARKVLDSVNPAPVHAHSLS